MQNFKQTKSANEITSLVKLFKKGRKHHKEVLEELLYIPREEALNYYNELVEAGELETTLLEQSDLEAIAYLAMADEMKRSAKVCFEGTLRDACKHQMRAEFKKLREELKVRENFEKECAAYAVDKETYLEEFIADPKTVEENFEA